MLKIVEILSADRKSSKLGSLVDLVSRNYFPIAESLAICEKASHTSEACAVLYRRKGVYDKSVEMYLKVL